MVPWFFSTLFPTLAQSFRSAEFLQILLIKLYPAPGHHLSSVLDFPFSVIPTSLPLPIWISHPFYQRPIFPISLIWIIPSILMVLIKTAMLLLNSDHRAILIEYLYFCQTAQNSCLNKMSLWSSEWRIHWNLNRGINHYHTLPLWSFLTWWYWIFWPWLD